MGGASKDKNGLIGWGSPQKRQVQRGVGLWGPRGQTDGLGARRGTCLWDRPDRWTGWGGVRGAAAAHEAGARPRARAVAAGREAEAGRAAVFVELSAAVEL